MARRWNSFRTMCSLMVLQAVSACAVTSTGLERKPTGTIVAASDNPAPVERGRSY